MDTSFYWCDEQFVYVPIGYQMQYVKSYHIGPKYNII